MSFYGNVTYYLSNSFSTITYDNSNLDSTTTPSSTIAGEYRMVPRGRDDETRLINGNKWIYFCGDSASYNNRACYITHKINELGEQTFPVMLLNQEESQGGDNSSSEGVVSPQFGQIITIPQITFDEAGHLASGQSISVKFPVPQGQEDINAIKQRLAELEELIKGEHGDAGAEEGSEDDGIEHVTNPYAARINELNDITAQWDLLDENTPAVDRAYSEQYGIGTTLHELMTIVGTRIKENYTTGSGNNAHEVTGYRQVTGNNYSMDSILGKLSTVAIQSAAVVENRNALIEVMNTIEDLHGITFSHIPQRMQE